jgi:hypothetical protein
MKRFFFIALAVVAIAAGAIQLRIASAQQWSYALIQPTSPPQLQTGNIGVSGKVIYGVANTCSATSGLPCSATATWLGSGASSVSSPVPVPSGCNPVVSANGVDTTTRPALAVKPTTSPSAGMVITETYPSAQPTATAGANLQCV